MILSHRTFGFALVLAAAMGIFVTGCGPEVVPASKHDPISPEAVKFYQKQPAKYEELVVISVPVTPAMKWNEQGDATPAFEALRAKAAATGANGVLLIAQPGTFDVMATAGFKGTWYQVPVKRDPKTLVAKAIYVISE